MVDEVLRGEATKEKEIGILMGMSLTSTMCNSGAFLCQARCNSGAK